MQCLYVNSNNKQWPRSVTVLYKNGWKQLGDYQSKCIPFQSPLLTDIYHIGVYFDMLLTLLFLALLLQHDHSWHDTIQWTRISFFFFIKYSTPFHSRAYALWHEGRVASTYRDCRRIWFRQGPCHQHLDRVTSNTQRDNGTTAQWTRSVYWEDGERT